MLSNYISSLRRSDERGVAAIMVAMFLIVLFGMAALAIDLGLVVVARNELQNAADSAALAGLIDYAHYGPSEGEQTADTYATNSDSYRLISPIPNTDAVDSSYPAVDTMRVRVRKAQGTSAGPIPAVFAKIWGTQTLDVAAVAVAKLERGIIGTGPGNLLPFGIKRSMADANGDGLYDLGNVIDIFPHPWAHGDFGLLDLDGGSNSNDDIVRWIYNGYDADFVLNQGAGDLIVEGSPHMNIEGKPGVVGMSIDDAVNSRIGDRVLFPIFDQVTGNGANAEYRVTDFMGGIIRSAKLGQALGQRELMVEITQFAAPNIIIGGQGTPTNNSVSAPVLIQ